MNREATQDSGKIRLLFVDDEDAIRMTLPSILRQQGFQVTAAASVPEALEIMNHQAFEVLLTDLNIGNPADGFVLVNAMRRIQPQAATFILTGYPDFESALEAIRKQVDDYFTKPAEIESLVAAIREKAVRPRPLKKMPAKRVPELIRDNRPLIIDRWLNYVKRNAGIAALPCSDADQTEELPRLLEALAEMLEGGEVEASSKSLGAAAAHGKSRARQGYTIPLLVTESRVLNRVIAEILYENLLAIDLSTLVPDALKVGEFLQMSLESTVRGFQDAETTGTKLRQAKRG